MLEEYKENKEKGVEYTQWVSYVLDLGRADPTFTREYHTKNT
ncbi:hypothetical protein LBH_0677 [Lactobacillus helveticus H9]|nr:hypothetical protein LBH_0677 [Lactobacillus helveticus H9]